VLLGSPVCKTELLSLPSAVGRSGQSMEFFLLVCARCDAEFVLDRRCYHGQQYCSPECSQQARDESLQRAKTKYAASNKGKRNHCERENRRRQKLKKTEEVDARKLTDQCSQDPSPTIILENETASSTGMSSAESTEVTERLVASAGKVEPEARPVGQRDAPGLPVTCSCRDCGATGRITRWEVRPGSGRRGVWSLVAHLGARGRQPWALSGSGRSNAVPWEGARRFG